MWIRLEPFRNPKPALLNRFESPNQSRIFIFFCSLHTKICGKNAYPPPPYPCATVQIRVFSDRLAPCSQQAGLCDVGVRQSRSPGVGADVAGVPGEQPVVPFEISNCILEFTVLRFMEFFDDR